MTRSLEILSAACSCPRCFPERAEGAQVQGLDFALLPPRALQATHLFRSHRSLKRGGELEHITVQFIGLVIYQTSTAGVVYHTSKAIMTKLLVLWQGWLCCGEVPTHLMLISCKNCLELFTTERSITAIL